MSDFDQQLMFSPEQNAVDCVLERFPVLIGHIQIQRKGRILFAPLEKEIFDELFDYMVFDAGFSNFHMVMGVDNGENLGVIYALSNADHVIALIKEAVPKSAPVIRSVCEVFPNALWHERELVDLFGLVVEGLPAGPSYPLPDQWPAGNYPMRKDWNPAYFNKDTMTYEPPQSKENLD